MGTFMYDMTVWKRKGYVPCPHCRASKCNFCEGTRYILCPDRDSEDPSHAGCACHDEEQLMPDENPQQSRYRFNPDVPPPPPPAGPPPPQGPPRAQRYPQPRDRVRRGQG